MFAAAGCDRVVEHGRIVAEVAGLEVARASLGEDGDRWSRSASGASTGRRTP
jgi:hypothetical protein